MSPGHPSCVETGSFRFGDSPNLKHEARVLQSKDHSQLDVLMASVVFSNTSHQSSECLELRAKYQP